MAKVVDYLPPNGRDGSSTSKYHRYFDGQVWLLERGADWPRTSKSLVIAASLRQAAKRHGMTLTIRIVGHDQIYVQARRREEHRSGTEEQGQ